MPRPLQVDPDDRDHTFFPWTTTQCTRCDLCMSSHRSLVCYHLSNCQCRYVCCDGRARASYRCCVCVCGRMWVVWVWAYVWCVRGKFLILTGLDIVYSQYSIIIWETTISGHNNLSGYHWICQYIIQASDLWKQCAVYSCMYNRARLNIMLACV